MPDLTPSVAGGLAGAIALAMTTVKFLWDRGDREGKRLAALILSDATVVLAVRAVAIIGVEESGRFVSQKLYDEQRETLGGKLDVLTKKVDGLSDYIQSDQLPRAIIAAMKGGEQRRISIRRKNGDEEIDP